MEARQILSSRIEDIIFEHRNKAYGAYDIRQRYNKHVAIATAVAISFLVLALITPLILDKLRPEEAPVIAAAPPKSIAELETPPPLDETKPPPPPMEVPPPPKIIQFVPPTVTVEEVDEEPPTIEEIKTTTTGAKSQEGETDLNYSPPVEEQIIIEKPKEDNTIYEYADEMASFKGDYIAYLAEHIQYPQQAADNNIQGTVHLEVLIGKDGSIQDVKILKDIGGGCGKEAARVVSQMPKWNPAMQNGNPVNIRMKIPVKFVLTN